MNSRSIVQELVEQELPRTAVLAWQELPNTIAINQVRLQIKAPIGARQPSLME